MKQTTLHDGCIVNEPCDTTHQLVLREHTFTIPYQNLLVFHKGAPKLIHIKTISDGMLIPYLRPRTSHISYNSQAIATGATIYRRFDETSGVKKPYAYKLEKTQLEVINAYLSKLDTGLTLVPGKFVEIAGSTTDSLYISETSISHLLSYMLGIALIYGKRTIKNNTLLHVTIQLPLIETIALIEQTVLSYFGILQLSGYFVSSSYITQHVGQLLQITISDEEILSIRSTRLGIQHKDMTLYIKQLSSFLPKQDLTNYVLKLLHK